MFIVYLILGGVWGRLCYKHMNELLPIQVSVLHTTVDLQLTYLITKHYLSGLVGLVIIEMIANYGSSGTSTQKLADLLQHIIDT
jgi:hypothetical protein